MTGTSRRRSSVVEEVPTWVYSHPISPVPHLSFKLARYMFFSGTQWFFRTCCMLVFILILLPAFLKVGWYYLSSTDIIRNIQYGKNPRNFLDIYLPIDTRHPKSKRPVAIFLSGGVWLIGYKGWGAFMGKVLASHGIVAVMPDYRNFPQGTIEDMLSDCDQSIEWTCKHIDRFGGNSEEIYLMGQSAGAHLGALLLLQRGLEETTQIREKCQQKGISADKLDVKQLDELVTKGWKLSQIKSFVGISGPYNLLAVEETFHIKGLPRRLLHAIMMGRSNLRKYSPSLMLTEFPQFSDPLLKKRLNPFILMHGSSDRSVPYQITKEFQFSLDRMGIVNALKLYDEETHTSFIVENLMNSEGRENKDDFLLDIVTYIKGSPLTRLKEFRGIKLNPHQIGSSEEEGSDSDIELSHVIMGNKRIKYGNIPIFLRKREKLIPSVFVDAARIVNPF